MPDSPYGQRHAFVAFLARSAGEVMIASPLHDSD
jgi:hypothetical protein